MNIAIKTINKRRSSLDTYRPRGKRRLTMLAKQKMLNQIYFGRSTSTAAGVDKMCLSSFVDEDYFLPAPPRSVVYFKWGDANTETLPKFVEHNGVHPNFSFPVASNRRDDADTDSISSLLVGKGSFASTENDVDAESISSLIEKTETLLDLSLDSYTPKDVDSDNDADNNDADDEEDYSAFEISSSNNSIQADDLPHLPGMEACINIPNIVFPPKKLRFVLDFIYCNQDGNGNVYSQPDILRSILSPYFDNPEMSIEYANDTLHRIVSHQIEALFSDNYWIQHMGRNHRDENGRLQHLLIWFGSEKPPLPVVLEGSPYIAYMRDVDTIFGPSNNSSCPQ